MKKAEKISVNNRAFTLIEVLVALFIISGVFFTVLSTYSYHLNVFDRKKDELKLVLVAKEKLFLFRNNKLKQLEGEEEGIKYQIVSEDAELGLKKVVSRTFTKDEEVVLYDYVR